MLSWRLWRALQLPYVSHPLYRMEGVFVEPTPRRYIVFLHRYERIWVTILLLLLAMAGLFFGAAPLIVFGIGLPILSMSVVIPLATVSIGTLYGVSVAFAVSGIILSEQRRGRYILMTLTPHGIEGATWAMISIVLHTYGRFVQVRHMAETVFYTILGITIFLGTPTLIVSLIMQVIPYIMVLWVVVILAIFFDFIQSVNIACIVGVLAPTWATDRITVRNYALVAFLSLQVVTYLLVAVCCFFIIPQLELDPTHYLLACLLVFYLGREIITALLWKLMVKRLDTSLIAFDDTIRLGIRRVVWWIAIPNEVLALFQRLKARTGHVEL